MRPIMHHVAALAECTEVVQPIVGRVAVEMRCCEHDTGHPEPSRLHKVGPPSYPAAAITPGRRLLVEPTPVRQAADEGEVRPPTALTLAAGALEANAAAEFTPVRRIERSQLWAYGHAYAAFLPSTR